MKFAFGLLQWAEYASAENNGIIISITVLWFHLFKRNPTHYSWYIDNEPA